MKELSRRLSRTEMDFHRAAALRTFVQLVSGAVAEVDPKAGKNLANLFSERERQLVINPVKFIDAAVTLIKKLDDDVHERVIQKLLRLRDQSRAHGPTMSKIASLETGGFHYGKNNH